MNFAKYRVKPGAKVTLKDWDPDDRGALEGTKEDDQRRLEQLSLRLDQLQELLYAGQRHGVLVVLQGMDTSGKDGTIRQVFRMVDPLGVRAVSFRAPTEEELAHDFLWRVHQRTPARGEVVIFNRSHYEDVLVVRVHKSIDAAECKLRYRRINEFERWLAEQGVVVLKFFLHISKDEQKKRLQERLERRDKRWKFSVADLADRERWREYTRAYEDALGATSSDWAPWYVVPANSKTNRNLLVSSILVDALEGLKMRYPAPKQSLEGIVIR